MSSLIAGYEYDVFVSYRQKDNRSDHWVTKFVQALRDELDATFKEEISIYFDENPHDGLHETHDVDGSLKEKVKCIVFIPIVSQTYCDPNSFAWEHEFLAFIELAREDQFGLDIKLPNGNVAKRVLPVRIHEINDMDKALFNDAIGGAMRPVDFIYAAPGINRPLRMVEEDPAVNIKHTNYRDQINKVANAIREIIENIGRIDEQPLAKVQPEGKRLSEREHFQTKRTDTLVRLTIGVLIITALSLAYYLYSRSSQSGEGGNYKYDLAVMYFENFTDNEKFGDQLASLVHINLATDTSIHLVPRQMLFDEMKVLTGEPKAPDRAHATEIARRISARHILTGAVSLSGNTVLIQVELTEVANGKIVNTKKVVGAKDKIFGITDDICKQIAVSAQTEFNVVSHTTSNYEAYKLFYEGLQEYYGWDFAHANEKFNSAIALDSTFSLAYVFSAFSRNALQLTDIRTDIEPSAKLVSKAYKYASKLPPYERKLVEYYYQLYHDGSNQNVMKLAEELHKEYPENREIIGDLSSIPVSTLTNDQKLKLYEEYTTMHPSDGYMHNMAAYRNAAAGNSVRANYHLQRYIQLEPDNWNPFDSGWEINLMLNDLDKANFYLAKLKDVLNARAMIYKRSRHLVTLNNPVGLRNHYQQFKDTARFLQFQEMLPLSYLMEGRYSEAIRHFDGIAAPFWKTGNFISYYMLKLEKGLCLVAAHRYQQANLVFEEVIQKSPTHLAGQYSPYLFLAHYYKGISDTRAGDLVEARKELDIIKSFVDTGINDWRFDLYTRLLECEILLADNSLDQCDLILNRYHPDANMHYLYLKYNLYWRKGQFAEALDCIIPFTKNYMGLLWNYGGNPFLFTWELALSDYHAGRIYEDAGNKREAIKYYTSFLEKFKNADHGLPEVNEAKKRLSSLK